MTVDLGRLEEVADAETGSSLASSSFTIAIGCDRESLPPKWSGSC